ncbi:hypothetical protein V6U90_30565 [Micromonospora sp. CPCC 206060]|uniref:hypothetical protein n=1 Tax=Micromonospora sp. CPCC 206060 TaxID=3122406 RepID=UPI002FF1F6A4
MSRRTVGAIMALAGLLALGAAAPALAQPRPDAHSGAPGAFVVRLGDDLKLGAKTFRFAFGLPDLDGLSGVLGALATAADLAAARTSHATPP